jgi:hypothetical protein
MTDKKRSESEEREGTSYAATEREQTRDIERARHPQPDEAGEFITDAEMEVREANGDQ